jgi:hypothetical protein
MRLDAVAFPAGRFFAITALLFEIVGKLNPLGPSN